MKPAKKIAAELCSRNILIKDTPMFNGRKFMWSPILAYIKTRVNDYCGLEQSHIEIHKQNIFDF